MRALGDLIYRPADAADVSATDAGAAVTTEAVAVNGATTHDDVPMNGAVPRSVADAEPTDGAAVYDESGAKDEGAVKPAAGWNGAAVTSAAGGAGGATLASTSALLSAGITSSSWGPSFAWVGYMYEKLCRKHLPQLRQAEFGLPTVNLQSPSPINMMTPGATPGYPARTPATATPVAYTPVTPGQYPLTGSTAPLEDGAAGPSSPKRARY